MNNCAVLSDYTIPLEVQDIIGYDHSIMKDLWFVLDATQISTDMQLKFRPKANFTFHPRTDANNDFLIKAGKVNVYMITEYKPYNYMMARWEETEGANQ